MKVVINRCHGGFSLSRAAWLWLRERGQPDAVKQKDPLRPQDPDEDDSWYALRSRPDSLVSGSFVWDIPRDDPLLLECVEVLGSKVASGMFAALKIVEIPDGVEWEIEEYDGAERVAEKHERWS